MFQILWPGAMAAQAVYAAAKLGIADLLKGRGKTAAEAAQATRTHAPTLVRFLRALVGLGILNEDGDGRFRTTPLGEALRSDRPDSARAWALMLGAPFIWRPWGELCETVATGQPAFERIFGTTFFEHLTTHPEDAAIFDAAMSSQSSGAGAILDAYDFSRFERIVDVGGGQGELLRAILSANSHLRGVLYDLRTVVAGATVLGEGPLSSRCEIVGGDFFDSVPNGADAYILKEILHSHDDADAIRILKNCRQAIREDGTLLILGTVVDPSSEANANAGLMDLMMLLLSPGKERTEGEYAALLKPAGFKLNRVIRTAGPSIVECRPQ